MKTFWKIFLSAFFIYFFSWILVYKTGLNQLPIQSEDTLPALFLPAAIIKEKSIYLDTYYPELLANYPHPDDKKFERGLTPFYLRKVGDHYVSAFPLVAGILAIPVYLVAELIKLPINLQTVIYLGHASAAIIVAFSGSALYALLKKHFQLDETKAKLLTYIYLFGTVNFALLSQALWQHGIVELFAILTLFAIFEKKWFWTGFLFSMLIITRPTTALMLPFLGLLAIPQLKLQIAKYVQIILGMLFPLGFVFWYTKVYYLGFGNQGYANHYLTSWLSPFPEGFLGMWFSPSKGILIYSPILIFAFAGLYLATKNKNWKKEENLKYVLFASIVLIHTLVLSIWKHWYGGWSYGYRMASDIIPFLVFLIVPFLTSNVFERYKKLFFILFIFSILVQIHGIIFFDGIWHAAYDGGFVNTEWLWSVKDSELAFNIRRVLVKFGMLQQACPKCL